MKILVKPITKNLNDYTKNADAFLFGIKNFSYIQTCIVTIKELKKITQKTDKKIFVAIDKNIFNKDIEELKKILLQLNNLPIEGLLFYDLSVMYLGKKMKLNIPLIWNQNFLVTNYKTCNYYKKEGIKGAIISSEITLDEIKEIRENTNLQLFVNIFGYQMMSFSRRKLITNYFKYIRRKNSIKNNYIIEKNIKYPIKETKGGTILYSDKILDATKYKSKLKDIDYLVFDENMIRHDNFLKVLQYFKDNKKIDSIISNTSTIFFDKKTIYKVKNK